MRWHLPLLDQPVAQRRQALPELGQRRRVFVRVGTRSWKGFPFINLRHSSGIYHRGGGLAPEPRQTPGTQSRR